ncbi:outer membrane beta-barrel protein [Leptospira levettii]|uniref:outer membrane beta-barrel protein n=1 Tax=Leptospira levettii TaxID=2023178 RepID=UPI00108283B4|nr:outer membrane beta-barrel protein [Leptospira levettii]TGL05054.1 porin [Leptospira levettii]TGM31433.1 porin [Leptospira levettii]TGM91800.1 porin [Leptospira levettii]
MRNKYTLLATIVATLFSQASLFAQTKKDKDKPWYELVNFSGYVDVYYNYTSNNRQGATQDTAGTFHTYNKQFAVNAVKLSMEKLADKESPWGFRLDMQNGQNNMYQERPYQTTNSLHNMQLLQQAYVSAYFPVLKGLTVDAGKMATHIGLELLDSKDNIAYTIGYVFFNTIPFIHTGARANLQINDRLSTGLYLYNSAQGTGYTGNGQQFGYVGLSPYGDAAGGSSLTSTQQHAYADGPNPTRAIGTQVKYDVVPDKFQVVWNTLQANDNIKGRQDNSLYYLEQATGTSFPKQSSFKTDHWMIQNLILIYKPTDRLTTIFDYTYGDRSGQTNTAAYGYEPGGITKNKLDAAMPGLVPDLPAGLTAAGLTADTNLSRENKVRRIYQTYQVQAKYQFTDTFALGFRFEYLDDKRYGGSLVVNPPLFAVTPTNRYDLKFQDSIGARATSNYGQIKTLTFTPTFDLTENLQVKVDLRRDWGPGQQFVDTSGRPASHQNGIIVGMVAKF